MTKIAITGGTGLIGSAIREYLQSKGYDCHVLTTSKRSASVNNEHFFWNPSEKYIASDALKGVDTIIHLAGSTINQPWNSKGKRDIIQSRIQAADTLFAFLSTRENNVKNIIAASAIGMYPDKGEDWVDENDEAGKGFQGEVIAQWEKALIRFESLPVRLFIPRIGIVLSGDGGALPVMAKPVRWGLSSAIGSGKQYLSWIHIDDVVGIFHHALTHPKLSGIFNAVAPNPATNSVFTRTLAKVLRKPHFLPRVPGFLLRITMGERADLALRGSRVSSQKITDTGYTFKYPELDNALEKLLGK